MPRANAVPSVSVEPLCAEQIRLLNRIRILRQACLSDGPLRISIGGESFGFSVPSAPRDDLIRILDGALQAESLAVLDGDIEDPAVTVDAPPAEPAVAEGCDASLAAGEAPETISPSRIAEPPIAVPSWVPANLRDAYLEIARASGEQRAASRIRALKCEAEQAA